MNRNRAFAILSAVLISLTCCSDPISHDLQTPEYKYRDLIEVVYTRDLSTISSPEGPRDIVLNYVLLDHSGSTYAEGETIAFEQRSGAVEMESIGDNKFRAYLKHVLIHQGLPNEKFHYIYVFDDDEKIHVAIGHGVDIQGAWDTIVFDSANAPFGSTELKFKMGKD